MGLCGSGGPVGVSISAPHPLIDGMGLKELIEGGMGRHGRACNTVRPKSITLLIILGVHQIRRFAQIFTHARNHLGD